MPCRPSSPGGPSGPTQRLTSNPSIVGHDVSPSGQQSVMVIVILFPLGKFLPHDMFANEPPAIVTVSFASSVQS